jgi:hypothetical protein
VDGEDVPAGDVVRLLLELEVTQPVTVDYKASLRLVGVDGQRATVDFDLLDRQEDAERGTAQWATGQRVTVRRGIWAPASLGPQPYSVRLVVYDPATLTPLLPVEAGDAAGASDRVAAPGGEAPVGEVYVTQSLAGLPPGAEAGYRPVDRRFGGGDDFDALDLVGVRAGQADPAAGPLTFDLLWRLEGSSDTEHRSVLQVVDAAGTVWAVESRPLFGGTFAMHDWRERETLAERRSVDLRGLPAGRYRILVGLSDARGRGLPVSGPASAGVTGTNGAARPATTPAGPAGDGTATAAAAPAGGTVVLATFDLPYRRPFGQCLTGLLARLPGWARLVPVLLGTGDGTGTAPAVGPAPGAAG